MPPSDRRAMYPAKADEAAQAGLIRACRVRSWRSGNWMGSVLLDCRAVVPLRRNLAVVALDRTCLACLAPWLVVQHLWRPVRTLLFPHGCEEDRRRRIAALRPGELGVLAPVVLVLRNRPFPPCRPVYDRQPSRKHHRYDGRLAVQPHAN